MRLSPFALQTRPPLRPISGSPALGSDLSKSVKTHAMRFGTLPKLVDHADPFSPRHNDPTAPRHQQRHFFPTGESLMSAFKRLKELARIQHEGVSLPVVMAVLDVARIQKFNKSPIPVTPNLRHRLSDTSPYLRPELGADPVPLKTMTDTGFQRALQDLEALGFITIRRPGFWHWSKTPTLDLTPKGEKFCVFLGSGFLEQVAWDIDTR